MNKAQVERAKEIGVPDEQIRLWLEGMFIQDAMPDFSASEREYVLTGMTDEMWDKMFSGMEGKW